jgi:tetratricopeptide (TPR) repeat protein
VKIHGEVLPKILVFSSILIIAVIMSASIIKRYVADMYYSRYQNVLKEDRQDVKRQIYYLGRALKFCPSKFEYLFEHGRFYINEMSVDKSEEDMNKSYELAKEFFQKALMCRTSDGKYWAEYAWHIGRNGETNEAIECFDKAINLGMTDAFIHKSYARWCVNQVKKEINFQNTVLFVEMYRKKWKLDEIMQSYNSRFINGVSIATFLRIAQTEWDKALSLGANRDQTAYNSLADLNLLRCELDEAIGNYNRANNKIMLTRCHFIKGDYHKVVNTLGSIIKGGGIIFWENLAKIKKILIDVTKESPKNYQSFYLLGEIYTKLGLIEKAIVNFERVIELNPQHIDAHLNLGKLYGMAGRIDLAIEEYEIALSLNIDRKEAADLLSEAIRDKYKDAKFMMK